MYITYLFILCYCFCIKIRILKYFNLNCLIKTLPNEIIRILLKYRSCKIIFWQRKKNKKSLYSSRSSCNFIFAKCVMQLQSTGKLINSKLNHMRHTYLLFLCMWRSRFNKAWLSDKSCCPKNIIYRTDIFLRATKAHQWFFI